MQKKYLWWESKKINLFKIIYLITGIQFAVTWLAPFLKLFTLATNKITCYWRKLMPNSTYTSTIEYTPTIEMDSININTMPIPMPWPSPNNKAKRYYFIAKRSFDIFISTIAIILLSPVLLTVALLIRLDSKGPIFFSQLRVGKGGKTFNMWKFRSMYIDAEQRQPELMKNNEMQGGVLFKIKDDPRVTRVGRILRKFSIDELPQLWNVWRGDMSLVGPRPPIPTEVQEYTYYQWKRLEATPGITCIWQISGRSDIPFPQQVELDLIYIRDQSLKCDLIILVQTIPAVLKARGAY